MPGVTTLAEDMMDEGFSFRERELYLLERTVGFEANPVKREEREWTGTWNEHYGPVVIVIWRPIHCSETRQGSSSATHFTLAK